MNMIKTLVAIGLISVSACAFADLKVGIVNVQGVFAGVPQGQATVNKMKQSVAPQVTALNKEETSLQTAVANFNRNAPTLSAADKAKQEQALKSQQQQVQRDVDSFRQATEQDQQQAAAAFQKDLVTAISQVAQQGNYDMVLTNQTIPFYKDSFDMTNQVIKVMSTMSSN